MASQHPLAGAPPAGPPKIALKLTPAGHKKQQEDPNFIAELINTAENGRSGLVPSVNPLIPEDHRPARLSQRIAAAAASDPLADLPNFDVWYEVVLEGQASLSSIESESATTTETPADAGKLSLPKETLELIHRLHRLDEVESVHALQPGPPPAVNPSDDPRSVNQGYLDAAPAGINARYAWGFPGGDGVSVNIVDMEQGWNLNHEDLQAAGITLISGYNAAYYSHGTAVLGEMLQVDNTIGGVGIVPKAKGRVISQHRPTGYNTAATILDAVNNMAFGDILLLEAQEFDPVGGQYYWPVSVADANFDAIRLASALGITVVEAACNGGYDLDAYVNLSGKYIFNRSTPDYKESGATMVGASSSAAPHYRLWYSNHGSRVDVYAWGENIDTTFTDDNTGTENYYTDFFSGTSGASPIIVGAAAAVQGIANASLGYKFSPLQLRQILTTNGTPSSTPSTDRIGVMPNLRAIIDGRFINLAPDLYIRDYIGDNGRVPSSGTVSNSPDIIVRQTPVSNPQALFGQGSGNENSTSLSQTILAGRDHSIYIRLLNRGGSPAQNTKVTVYYAPAATLITPNLWTLIGTVTLPRAVPTGRVLTVSPRLAWPGSKVPAVGPGGYSFVAIATTDKDPAPVLPTTFPAFVEFVSRNNNVAWKAFNVVAPHAVGASIRLQVGVAGAFDAPRKFSLRGVGSLPMGSEVRLEVPVDLARRLGVVTPWAEAEDEKGKVVLVPLHPFGRGEIGEGILPVGSVSQCELVVKVPEEEIKREGQWEYEIVQAWDGVDVGRLTWKFERGDDN
ncbi:peptidase S8/S53 domain-containing protein [Apiosordaria backusii]|uniref:Peptidase S8/S53 domain-containing protein n=1 Tax=Apiosordaria backusii TaxID=314023 RepID=A0AA40BM20_9PEZI|nr:peptidase S8/S53 domain-containing protein [Apiosordaria backusii]